jgi:predicted O-methyltransferase YrrM
MTFESVAAAVEGVPFMSAAQGRTVFDHVRRTRPEAVLDLGTAHGVSSAYLAAALEANGRGHVTTVESSAVRFEDPTAEELLARAGSPTG